MWLFSPSVCYINLRVTWLYLAVNKLLSLNPLLFSLIFKLLECTHTYKNWAEGLCSIFINLLSQLNNLYKINFNMDYLFTRYSSLEEFTIAYKFWPPSKSERTYSQPIWLSLILRKVSDTWRAIWFFFSILLVLAHINHRNLLKGNSRFLRIVLQTIMIIDWTSKHIKFIPITFLTLIFIRVMCLSNYSL